MLENTIYLELIRRGNTVHIGQMPDGTELDFIATAPDSTTQYFQVSASTLDPQTLERELHPFGFIRDNYPKTLLTLDTIQPDANYDGIIKQNALEWLSH